MLRDVPANQQVVRGTVFDRLVATKGLQAGSGRNNRLAKGKLDAVQLARHKNAGEKIADHTNGVQVLRESPIVCRNVKTGHAAHFRIAQRCDYRSQVVWFHANVAVVNDQHLVARFLHHALEFGHFIVDGLASGANQDANLPVGKIVFQLFEDRHRGIVLIADAENQFILGIVLAAVTGQVLVGFGIQPAKGFQVADRRSEIRILR